MPRKILVLTGSPRKQGNTDALAEAFIKGARAAGHEITRFDVARMAIKPCMACDKCFSKGAACIFDDDFNAIAPHFERCDVLVLALPLYCFSFPANIKTAIDKLYAFDVSGRAMSIKECALLACAGDEDSAVFAGLTRSYELLAAYEKWTDRGRVLASGVYAKGDALGTDFPAKAEELGRKI